MRSLPLLGPILPLLRVGLIFPGAAAILTITIRTFTTPLSHVTASTSQSNTMSSLKSKPHAVARHYKSALSDSTGDSRDVLIRSFRTKGDIVEMISVENARSKDDAFIQAVRDEIRKQPPYHGEYAKKMGLFHIATRRISHETNDVLYRHTGPKKVNNELVRDELGNLAFYPRMYILRLISDEERSMEPDARATYRRKVLSTIAHILHRQEEARGAGSTWNDPRSKTTPSPKARARAPVSPSRRFSPTKFNVPKIGWDLTPEDPLPLDWYITDQMVATTIDSIYIEQEVGGWHMFHDNVAEADCFFSAPYSYVARTYGFRNPGESSVREPREVEVDCNLSVEQAFDADDVLPLG